MGLHDFTMTDIEGNSFDFGQLKGRKVMLVNTASECGLTQQYEQLQALHAQHRDKLAIIGFPSNDFGAQEPGADADIGAFCQKNYGVTFKLMSKVSVKGEGQCALYEFLTSKEKNDVADYEVEWNFHKFLIDEDGKLVQELKPDVLPIDEVVLTWIGA